MGHCKATKRHEISCFATAVFRTYPLPDGHGSGVDTEPPSEMPTVSGRVLRRPMRVEYKFIGRAFVKVFVALRRVLQ